MPHQAFISYARRTSRGAAEALHRALGGDDGLAFLDTSDIETGERFPKALGDALLAAKVVIVFADEDYFKRWYCLRELRMALAPFEALLRGGSVSDQEKIEALSHVVLALPPQGGPPTLLDGLPSLLRTANWPSANETDRLAQFIKTRLNSTKLSLNEHLGGGRGADDVRTALLEESALPPPMNLAGAVQFPLELPGSLGDAFVGRADDLWRIHFTLSTMRGEPAASAALTGSLEGGGGSGKTRLALEYLHRFAGHYPGGLFWVDADVAAEQLQSRFHGILRTLKSDTPDLYALREQFQKIRPEDTEGFTKELARRLAEAFHALPPERPVLFIVDNVPEAPIDASPKPLNAWCPAMGEVSLLTTSRAKVLGSFAVVSIPVETLDRKSAVTLLTSGLDRRSIDERSWEKIAEWVGDLPLALELLQQSLRAGVLSPGELFNRTNRFGTTEELDRQMSALRGQVPAGSLRGITEALRVSYEKLPEKTQEAARLLAFLAPDPIPMELVEKIGSGNFPAEAKAALIARSFITQLPGGVVPIFGTMHRVLADFLRSCSKDPAIEAAVMVNSLIELMQPEKCRDPMAWPLMNSCLPHAEWLFGQFDERNTGQLPRQIIRLGQLLEILLSSESLLQRARKLQERVLEVCQRILGEEHPDTLNSMNNLALTLLAQGDLAGARRLQERVFEICRRIQGEEHSTTLASMNNLASTLSAQGELTGARKLQERVVEVGRRLQDEEDPGRLSSMNNLALSLWAQGDFAGARKLQERVLKVCQRVEGEEHPHTLTSMNNLASTLSAQGDFAGARKLHERVLEICRRILGEEHSTTLTSMSNLASTLWAQDDFAGARELQERVLEISWRILGEEHSTTLTSISNLASTLWAQGNLAGARKLQERVLKVCQRVEGEEHPDTLTSMGNLALTLSALGDFAGARKLEEQALGLRRRALGEEHPDTLKAMNNLAVTLRAQGDLVRARELEERALEVRRRVLGEEHPDTLKAIDNLELTLLAQGDCAGAPNLREEPVLEVRRRAMDEEHPDTLTAMNNLASTLRAHGDRAGARQLEERVLEVCRRVLGEEHPHTLTAMNNLASTLWAQGDLADARKLQEPLLEVSQRVLGEEHPDTLTAMNNLALTLCQQGDLADARKLQEPALEVSRRVLGEEHPDTLTAMNNLASTLLAQEDFTGAHELQERVLELRRRVLGEEHPDTLTSMNNLASTLWAQGDFAGARKLQEQALELRRRVLGEEHSHTLASMNNLALTLSAQGDIAGARKLQERVLEVRNRRNAENSGSSITSRRSTRSKTRTLAGNLLELIRGLCRRVLGK